MQIPRPHQGFFELMRKLQSRGSSAPSALHCCPEHTLSSSDSLESSTSAPSFPSKRHFHPQTAFPQGSTPPIPLPGDTASLSEAQQGQGMLWSSRTVTFLGQAAAQGPAPVPPAPISCTDTIKLHCLALQIRRNNPFTNKNMWHRNGGQVLNADCLEQLILQR